MPNHTGFYKSLLLFIGIALMVIYFVEKSTNGESCVETDDKNSYDGAMTGLITLGGLLVGFSGGTFLHCESGEESDVYLFIIMAVLIAIVSCASVALSKLKESDDDNKKCNKWILGSTIGLTVLLGVIPVGMQIFYHPSYGKKLRPAAADSPDTNFGFSFEF